MGSLIRPFHSGKASESGWDTMRYGLRICGRGDYFGPPVNMVAWVESLRFLTFHNNFFFVEVKQSWKALLQSKHCIDLLRSSWSFGAKFQRLRPYRGGIDSPWQSKAAIDKAADGKPICNNCSRLVFKCWGKSGIKGIDEGPLSQVRLINLNRSAQPCQIRFGSRILNRQTLSQFLPKRRHLILGDNVVTTVGCFVVNICVVSFFVCFTAPCHGVPAFLTFLLGCRTVCFIFHPSCLFIVVAVGCFAFDLWCLFSLLVFTAHNDCQSSEAATVLDEAQRMVSSHL